MYNSCTFRFVIQPHFLKNARKYCSISDKLGNGTENEKKLIDVLRKRFSNANELQVVDVSGGCGAMFDIKVVSPEFKGIDILKQHQMVTDALKSEIKQMHGLRICTSHLESDSAG